MKEVMLGLFWILLCQVLIPIDAAATLEDSSCIGTYLNYTKNSIYEKNLNLVLSELAPRASIVKFHNLTVGQDLNKVYSLFQCRQDVSPDVCSSCIKDATQYILLKCPLYGEAIVWYKACLLRYSNRNIFGLMEMLPSSNSWSTSNASNINRFITVLGQTMDGVITDAASTSRTLGHFATREANLSFPEKLYCLAQCTPDITKFDCNSCLRNALALISGYCTGCTRGRNFSPSCQLWYALSPFYAESTPGPPPTIEPQSSGNKSIIVGTVGAAAVGLLLLVAGIWVCTRKGKAKEPEQPLMSQSHHQVTESYHGANSVGDAQFDQYDFATLKTATGAFSKVNKLGEGGFGSVYKGVLKTGETLAIKRLSAGNSGQGVKEFMTEAGIVAQLQHKNLVKLVGVCSQGDEKLLVYEFMPNTSLDHILFDPIKRGLLEWSTRFKITVGIAKGLQYLHEDSRLTIIHRDLKASNILLDGEMNPKIADFGIAKLFGGEQNFGNTSCVIGTFGYMAPEYMLQGEYSDKSDVYSFGIIVLEIVSGQKNRVQNQAPQKENLPNYTWKLWKTGQAVEIIDPMVLNKCSFDELMRCIQIGLLCVQGNPSDRPTMGKVVLMLNGLIAIPTPRSLAIPSREFSLPMKDYHFGSQYGSEQTNTHSVTWRTTNLEQDLYPR